MVHADGTERHIHEFKNFTQKGGPITLSNHTLITGTVDITKDGQDLFKGVYIALMIENKSIASIAVDSQATQNHFGGQPIYVVFTSFKDKNGTDLFQSNTSSATATSSVGNALSKAGNTTSSFLGNASKAITGLFNKTK